jgi:hypothetical protein
MVVVQSTPSALKFGNFVQRKLFTFWSPNFETENYTPVISQCNFYRIFGILLRQLVVQTHSKNLKMNKEKEGGNKSHSNKSNLNSCQFSLRL